MAKTGRKRAAGTLSNERLKLIEGVLRKQSKAEFIALLLAIGAKETAVLRELENRLPIEKPLKLLSAEISVAIARATDFEAGGRRQDLDVDWEAYEEVKNGLLRLIELGQLAEARMLATQLMQAGSRQVEASDEGLMADELSACLRPVIRAVQLSGDHTATEWAAAMQAADRVGFICERELAKLRGVS